VYLTFLKYIYPALPGCVVKNYPQPAVEYSLPSLSKTGAEFTMWQTLAKCTANIPRALFPQLLVNKGMPNVFETEM
jgi:hypothetical protein